MMELFDLPIDFWSVVLGKDLHFHMGHFPNGQESLEDGEAAAINNLLGLFPPSFSFQPIRILDIGCGWGGPAFQLTKTLKCEVVGVVFNQTQSNYVNARATTTSQPVWAIQADAETFDFAQLGYFDVAWVYESLDHMTRRHAVLAGLRKVARFFALAIHCRDARIPKSKLYNEFFGIPSCECKDELLAMLAQTGWQTLTMEDRTGLVLPSFAKWVSNIKRVRNLYPLEAEALLKALQATEGLYRQRSLHSIQLVAEGKS